MCGEKGKIILESLDLDLDEGPYLRVKFVGDSDNLFCLIEELRNLIKDVNASKSGKV